MSHALGWSYPAGCSRTPYDEDGVFERKIDGTWFAWTEDGKVFEHTGSRVEREDGYVLIGELHPLDEPEYDPEKAFIEYVVALKRGHDTHCEKPPEYLEMLKSKEVRLEAERIHGLEASLPKPKG